MSAGEALSQLVTWTPFMLRGLAWNMAVAATAMLLGTALGAVLASARADAGRGLARLAALLTHASRNVPTFVFLFYLAYLLPSEVELAGRLVAVPPWIKASLALAVAVVGFVSDNLTEARLAWRRGDHVAAYLFLPNWTIYFVIIIMASSTASVIGVPELVSRANTVIGAVGDDGLMVWVYGWAMLIFFLVSMPLTVALRRVKAVLVGRTLRARAPC